MKRKRTTRTRDEVIQALKVLFSQEVFDDNLPLPKTFEDEWNPRLDAFAHTHLDAILNTLEQGRLEEEAEQAQRKASRSKQLWNKLLRSYPALSRLGAPEVYLEQIGGLETEGGSYFYGSRYDLEEEFELHCEINFSLSNPETKEEYVYIGIEAYIDTDIGSTKVYFSEPHVSMTTSVMIKDPDMPKMGCAIIELLRDELNVGDDFFGEIKYKITNEFRRLATQTK